MQQTVWQNVFIQTLELKLKNKSFSVRALPGMDFTNKKWVPKGILDYLSVQLIMHNNEISSFAQTFK